MKPKGKQAEQISMLNHDVDLFFHLYIVTKHQDDNMAAFHRHETIPIHHHSLTGESYA